MPSLISPGSTEIQEVPTAGPIQILGPSVTKAIVVDFVVEDDLVDAVEDGAEIRFLIGQHLMANNSEDPVQTQNVGDVAPKVIMLIHAVHQSIYASCIKSRRNERQEEIKIQKLIMWNLAGPIDQTQCMDLWSPGPAWNQTLTSYL